MSICVAAQNSELEVCSGLVTLVKKHKPKGRVQRLKEPVNILESYFRPCWWGYVTLRGKKKGNWPLS